MKKFLIDNGLKRCPECGEFILKKWEHCYKFEWCPYCGCNINEVFSKIDRKENNLN